MEGPSDQQVKEIEAAQNPEQASGNPNLKRSTIDAIPPPQKRQFKMPAKKPRQQSNEDDELDSDFEIDPANFEEEEFPLSDGDESSVHEGEDEEFNMEDYLKFCEEHPSIEKEYGKSGRGADNNDDEDDEELKALKKKKKEAVITKSNSKEEKAKEAPKQAAKSDEKPKTEEAANGEHPKHTE